jgi:site-specific DNA-methyltransferase (adenine-specific)
METTMLEYHPIANIFPLMAGDDYAALVADIAEHGQHEPIWLHPDGRIIDGRNRYRACCDLGVVPEYRTWDGNGSLVAFIVSLNLHRRHLTSSQRAVIALDVLPMLEEEARARMVTGVAADPVQRVEQGRSVHQAAAMTGTNHQYVSDAKRIAQTAPDLIDKVRSGKATIPQVKKEHDRRIRQEQETTAAAVPLSHDDYRLVVGDFAQVASAIEPGSVDIIITDPPYPREFLPLFGVLAQEASRILAPGGSLVVMVGQSYLPEVLNQITPFMRYHWTCAYLTPGGQAASMWQRKVNTFWKPLLWFVNGDYDGEWIGDVAKSAVNDNDKRFHHWGQSVSGMADVVSRFTKPGDVILDPFCGAATTGVAALLSGRRFVGVDIDADHIQTAGQRLQSVIAERGKAGADGLARPEFER